MILHVKLSKKDLIDELYPNKLGRRIRVINRGTMVLKEAKYK